MQSLTPSVKSLTMSTMTIAAVREFNRYYTNLIGVLRAGLHDSAYSLAEVRVLEMCPIDTLSEIAGAIV